MEIIKYQNEKLLEDFRAGDQSALEALLVRNKALVSQGVRKYFLIGSEMDDLVQEGMIGLYKAILSFDKKKNASFDTFAKVCINHQLQNAIKKSLAKKNQPLNTAVPMNIRGHDDEDGDEMYIPIVWTEENPESIVIDRERKLKLKSEIDKNLSEFEKNVLELYLDGKSYAEIGSSLGKTAKSIDNGLFRIKSKLKEITME